MSGVEAFRTRAEEELSNITEDTPQEIARIFGELYSAAIQQHPNDIHDIEKTLDTMFAQYIDNAQHQGLFERYDETKTYYNEVVGGLSQIESDTTSNELLSTPTPTATNTGTTSTVGATGELSYAPSGTTTSDTLDRSLFTTISLPTQTINQADSFFFNQYSQNTAELLDMSIPEYNQRLSQAAASVLDITNPSNHTIKLLHTDADNELEQRTIYYLSQEGTPIAAALADIRDTFPLMIIVDDTDYSQSSYGPIDKPENSQDILTRAESTSMTIMTAINSGLITPDLINTVRINRTNPAVALESIHSALTGLSINLPPFEGITDDPANIIMGLINQYDTDSITLEQIKQSTNSRLSGNGSPILAPSGQRFGRYASYPNYFALNTVHHDYQQTNESGLSTGGIATITLNPHMFDQNYGMLEGVLLNEISEIALLSKSDQAFTTARMQGTGDSQTITYTTTTHEEAQNYNPETSDYYVRPDKRNITSTETNNPYLDAHAHPGYQLLGGMMDIQNTINNNPSAEQMQGYVHNAREYYLWTYLSAGRGLAERYNFATEQETSEYTLQFMRLTQEGANAAVEDLNRRASALGLTNTVSFTAVPNTHTLGTIRKVMSDTVAHHLNTNAGVTGGRWFEKSVNRQNYLNDGSFSQDFGSDDTTLGGYTIIATFTNPDETQTQYDWLTGAIS